ICRWASNLIFVLRALLRRSQLLVLDELTTSVDLDTDTLVQNTSRECVRDCTVVTTYSS
ncbi:canalicular multispecific organic anion transporter 2-like, partial [Tropilaelaps mercedesae]